MPQQTAICSCCNKPHDSILMISCCVCTKLFKNTCVNISSNEVRMINGKKGFDWTCDKCREYGNDLKALKAIIINLQNDIQALKIGNPQSDSFDFEEIISEINERNRRKRNLIIFNVKEQDQSQSTEFRVNEDKTISANIMQTLLPNANFQDIKPVRLGRYNSDKCRPLRITLPNEDIVHNSIRSVMNLKKSQEYKAISISLDRTPRQIQYFKKVKKELEDRVNAGENDKILKYVNGIPKIVTKLN